MKTSTPTLPEDLKALRDRFAHWRRHRTHNTQVIPQALLVQAYQLTKVHRTTLVLSTLGLNTAQLKRGQAPSAGVLENNNKTPLNANTFIEVRPHPSSSMPSSLEIIRPDGMRLKLTHVEDSALRDVVEDFMGNR